MAVFVHAGETWLALAYCHQRLGQQEGHVHTQVLLVYEHMLLCTQVCALCAFVKLQKATFSCLSVHPYARVEQLGCHWKDFHKISFLRNFRKSVEIFNFNWNLTKITVLCMKKNTHFLSYFAQFYWEWEMLLTEMLLTDVTDRNVADRNVTDKCYWQKCYRQMLLREMLLTEMLLTENWRGNQSTHFMFSNFFSKIVQSMR